MTANPADIQEAVSELIDGYLDRMPGAREAARKDPVAHHTIGMLRHTLYLIEIAMQDEQIPEAIRLRVMRTVLAGGAPSVPAAEARIADIDNRIKAAEQEAISAARIDRTLAEMDEILGPHGVMP